MKTCFEQGFGILVAVDRPVEHDHDGPMRKPFSDDVESTPHDARRTASARRKPDDENLPLRIRCRRNRTLFSPGILPDDHAAFLPNASFDHVSRRVHGCGRDHMDIDLPVLTAQTGPPPHDDQGDEENRSDHVSGRSRRRHDPTKLPRRPNLTVHERAESRSGVLTVI